MDGLKFLRISKHPYLQKSYDIRSNSYGNRARYQVTRSDDKSDKDK